MFPLIFILVTTFLSIGDGYSNTAFNPEYPFVYPVPSIISYILDHPTLNKSTAAFNSPHANVPREKIGDYYYHRATSCGTHFLNPSEGYIISDKNLGADEDDLRHCLWGFVGNQFCTPSINCPRFHPRIKKKTKNPLCRTNYLQISDGGDNFAYHFCDGNEGKIGEYTGSGGLLDVSLRFSVPSKRPQFECLIKCVPYQVNFTRVNSQNETKIQVFPVIPKPMEKKHNVPPPTISKKCRCGISNNFPIEAILRNGSGNRMPRVLGGRETRVSAYPWMVALVHKDKQLPFCGASLINNRYVLTAQHCLDDENVDDFEVVLNEHDFFNKSETIGRPIRRRVKEFIKYNHYLDSVFDGDMALLVLDRPVNIFDSRTTPVCLPTNVTNSYIGVDVVGAGWGTLNETSTDKSPKLLEVGLQVMSNAACNDYHSSRPPVPFQVSERMLCSGYPEGGRDTCSGDSGGPLVTLENGQFIQIGVTSWGFGCGHELNPGVFARVTEFLGWIHHNTLDAVYCSS